MSKIFVKGKEITITGFNDDLYPGRSRNNSFIPYILRRGFDLPTPERKDAIFAYNFYRMLSYAKKVWLITNSIADDTHSGEVSRYFYQLQWQYAYNIQQIHVVNSLSTPHVKAKDIIKDETVQKQMMKLRQHEFSASAINKYLFCQKKFYYSYIMGLKEPQQPEDLTASDATLGTVLHDTMQVLYAPFEHKNVTKSDIQGIIDTIDSRWDSLPIQRVAPLIFSI